MKTSALLTRIRGTRTTSDLVTRANLCLLRMPSSLRAQLPSLLIFLGVFLVYLFTMAPTMHARDSAEFSAVIYKLGVPHATGYPLYILLGKLFTLLPVGDIAYRVNLMSGVFAAGTIVIVYQLGFLASGRKTSAMAAAGILAFSYYFWVSAVVAEVYALHAFLTAATIYLLLRWYRGDSNMLLYVAGFAWGLSFGNHMSTLLFAPAFAFLVVLGFWKGRIQPSQVAVLVGCILIPLVTYSYFPLRYMAGDVWPYIVGEYNSEGKFAPTDFTTLSGMWQLLTAQQFHGFLFANHGMDFLQDLGLSGWWLFSNFLGVGFVLGIVGVLCNFKVERPRLIFFGLILGVNALFFASYGAIDKEFMLPVLHLLWSIWIAEGLANIAEGFRNSYPRLGNLAAFASNGTTRPILNLESLFLVLPFIVLLVNVSYTDVSSDTSVKERYVEVLAGMEPDALVLGWWGEARAFDYLQQVEGMRPDVQVVDRFLITPTNEIQLIESSLATRPVYVFGHIPELGVSYDAFPTFSIELIGHLLVQRTASNSR
ncbi:MAG: DUF2723 domain-containing protein [Dehalococcoidia bacterium]